MKLEPGLRLALLRALEAFLVALLSGGGVFLALSDSEADPVIRAQTVPYELISDQLTEVSL